jgi:glucose-1-phosphate adenylyltransferase
MTDRQRVLSAPAWKTPWSQGSQVIEADIRRSVIGRNVMIKHGTCFEECVILDWAIIGSKVRLRRVIADQFNTIPPGTQIGFDQVVDCKRYQVSRSGIVVLPRERSIGDRAVETTQ